jgi:hypothetical protein
MIAGRGNGPHPFEIGSPTVQNYVQVMQNCTRAAQNWSALQRGVEAGPGQTTRHAPR